MPRLLRPAAAALLALFAAYSLTSGRPARHGTGDIPVAPILLPIDNGNGDPDYLVDWTDVPDATAYSLEEDADPTFPSPQVRYPGPDSFVAILYQPLGTWYYRVRASNAGGDGPWSNVEQVTVTCWLLPPALAPIDNADGDGDYVVSWSYVRRAQVYHLEEDSDPAFPSPSYVYLGPDLSFDVIGRPPGAWYYRVRAEGAGGSSDYSNVQLVIAWPRSVLRLPIILRSR